MIIFLDESLVTSLNDDTQNHSSILAALTICAQQAREGTHLLLGSRRTFEGLESHYAKMDPRTIATLRRSNDKLTFRKQIRDFVTRSVRLVSDSIAPTPIYTASGNRIEILLPASAVDSASSLVGKPLLMVENLNDGHAYIKLAKSVVNCDLFPGVGCLRDLPLRYEIRPGGGQTLAQLFAYEKDCAAHIGIAIADGDYRYADGPMGETARCLLEVAASAPRSALLEAIVLPVRAIENCIPRAEISRITLDIDPAQAARFAQIEALFSLSPVWRVVPMKAGVRCFELGQVTAESKFWTEVFEGRQCVQAQRCESKNKCDTFVLPSISAGLLPKSVCSGRELFEITANCVSGVEDVWRSLLNTIYSVFCGTEPNYTI